MLCKCRTSLCKLLYSTHRADYTQRQKHIRSALLRFVRVWNCRLVKIQNISLTRKPQHAAVIYIPLQLVSVCLQIVKMQEDPTNIPEGETPRSLLMYAYDTNVDACKPGDKVTITGKRCQQLLSCLSFRIAVQVACTIIALVPTARPCVPLPRLADEHIRCLLQLIW
jgi:DNA replicative helicase MCM subunit Mcm2 (Cdc46/Mcm family)